MRQIDVFVVLVDTSYPYDPGPPKIGGVFTVESEANTIAERISSLKGDGDSATVHRFTISIEDAP
jgi:hypothetical protein